VLVCIFGANALKKGATVRSNQERAFFSRIDRDIGHAIRPAAVKTGRALHRFPGRLQLIP
jgi:hypothetical protein